MTYKLPVGWEEVELGDIVELTMGQSPKSEFYNEVGEGLPFMQGNTTFGDKYPTIKRYTTKVTRLAYENEILMSVRAPVGDININNIKELCIGRGLCSIRMKNDNQKFLYFLMRHSIEQLKSKATGTVFSSVNKNAVEKLIVHLPPLTEQKVIADTLSVLDDKIESNNRINDNLETQAQALFKHWFVDFEFPDENGSPYKSSGGVMVESELGMIPDGWEVVKLIDIADRKNGYSYRSVDLSDDANNKMLTLKNFNRDGTYDYKSYRRINITDRIREHHFVEDDDILLACTDLTQKGEVVGNPVLYFEIDNFLKAVFSMDLVKIVPKDIIYKYFIYYSFKNRQFKEYAKNNSTGTTVLHFKKKSIDEFSLLKPNEKLANEFSKFGRAINDFIIKNAKENRKLAQLRDTLLPKLMSGEIRIPLEQ